MAVKFKIKRDDTVVVLAGKDKGKTGKVLRVVTETSRVVVQGVNIVKKHVKPSMQRAGGIEAVEAALHISNVAIADPDTGKATRVGYRFEGEKKVRFAKKSGKAV
ncbi:MAG: 50S ribosomal protein L24 [Alphaproteobacteria bacterium]|jgi:large subunit ribosomal protein L24|nr:50S ribosomal protein L24 [Thalassospira sp.]MCE2965113.1 50S ribosomal protein L24 [Alphaproteobacteria bacterium]